MIDTRSLVVAPLALLLAAAPAAAQHGEHAMQMPTEGLRAEWIRDIEQLEEKYMALAEAMAPHHAWRPAEGVRSVGEVFGHVAAANFGIPTMVGIQPPEAMRAPDMQQMMARMQAMERLDADSLRSELRHSFMHAKHAIARTPDADLDDMTEMFGQTVTKRTVLHLLVAHMHEHLGQAIAYARMNGVTPPWSGN